MFNGIFSAYAVAKESPMTSADCMGCHQKQSASWKKSDHAMAMALPTSKTVLGNFNQQSARHYSQTALFFTEKGEYKATIGDTNNSSSETFTVKYTFGHYPLQQYLVATKPGTYQVLPFAWDSRPANEGGQRWYHNYSQEEINSDDRLHWRQPLQNWNGMCADCHSDELERNYDPVANSFNTQYTGINVGCVSCHGVMDHHLEQIETQGQSPLANATSHALGQWVLEEGSVTATYKGETRDNEFMQTCFACHSLRSPLNDGFSANEKFLDQFSPNLITPPLYYADGQIKEEVYVYGSFLQSKMFNKGVNCLDCHDPHTMKVKIEGNGLCLQCHKASEFDTPEHHKHTAFTAGAQCVNCHMPDTVYMGVDNRRDHSFKIPSPHLSSDYDTPNACTDCHDDKDNKWATSAITKWYGAPKPLASNRQNLFRLRHGQGISLAEHLAIVKDTSIDTISRASALEMIARSTDVLSASQLGPFVRSSEDLIRLAAARVGNLVGIVQRVNVVAPLLDDPLKSVRAAAAQVLIGQEVGEQNIKVFTRAFNELTIANEVNAWRGEARVNQGNIALVEDNVIAAETAYKGSIEIDPYFPIAYMNLADLYRTKQREDLVAEVLTRGLAAVPSSADVAYAYGLHLVRMKKVSDAIPYFKNAMDLAPQNVQIAYTYALALDGNQQTQFAIKELKRFIDDYPNNSSLVELGQYMARKMNNRADFEWFTKKGY